MRRKGTEGRNGVLKVALGVAVAWASWCLLPAGPVSAYPLRHVWGANGDQASANFGRAVSNAGDVNGDGFDDVIIGARDGGHDHEGRAFVYLGSASGPESAPIWTAEGNQAQAIFGVSV